MSRLPTVEMIIRPKTPPAGVAILNAMKEAAPSHSIKVVVTKGYTGNCDMLMVYGFGRERHRTISKRYLRQKKHSVIWDAGYWDRDSKPHAYRLSIDGGHPTKEHLSYAPSNGLDRSHPPLESVGDPDGFILLTSAFSKSATLNNGAADVVLQQLADIKRWYPGRQIRYRPKMNKPILLTDLPLATGSIKEAMTGAALVVTQQSNVGVDAVIYGVPACVTGGIAAAFWPQKIGHLKTPSDKERKAFMERVAWFNWRPEEANVAWTFVRHVCAF